MANIKTSIQLYDGMTSPLKSMTRALEACVSSFESLHATSATGLDTSKIIQAREALTTVSGQLETIERNIDSAETQQREFNSAIKSGNDAMSGVASMVKRVALLVGAGLGLRKAFNLSDVLTQTTARLDMMNDGLQDTKTLQDMIFASAQRSRGSYQATADAVSKMGIMAKDAFNSNAELVAFAEQLNKQFTIAGTSQEGIAAAMLQLTQAMGSGVLRGEELNSVFEQAPTIIQAIAKHLGVPIGQIRSLAQDGKLSAEVVKNALLASAEETNAKFESMPKTIGQTWQSISNTALMAFQPVLTQISEIVNGANFGDFAQGLIGTLQTVAKLVTKVFGQVARMGSVIYRNWQTILPILSAVATAMIMYKTVALATTAVITAQKIANWAHTASLVAQSGATYTATVAQYGLNTALAMCPITWIVAGVVALGGALLALATHLAKSAGLANTFIGTITGGVTAMIEAVKHFEESFKASIANVGVFFYNMFRHIQASFFDTLSVIGQGVGYMAKLMDKIPGVKMDSQSIFDQAQGYANKAQGYIDMKKSYIIPDWAKEAFKQGSAWGDSLVGGTTSMADMPSTLEGIYQNTLNTSVDTQRMADSMGVMEDSIEYMRDIAEREAINRFTTAEIKIEQTNNNNISSDMDIDDVMSKWNANFTEILATASEGVHN